MFHSTHVINVAYHSCYMYFSLSNIHVVFHCISNSWTIISCIFFSKRCIGFISFFCFFDAGLTGLTHLDLFGARISDTGTNCLKCALRYLSIVWTYSYAEISVTYSPSGRLFIYLISEIHSSERPQRKRPFKKHGNQDYTSKPLTY